MQNLPDNIKYNLSKLSLCAFESGRENLVTLSWINAYLQYKNINNLTNNELKQILEVLVARGRVKVSYDVDDST